jgi:radical SAM superfamily enzyme YgiQ (UPF0313 family)
MKKLNIGIIDLIYNKPSQSLYRRYMYPNFMSVMPQVIGVWCRQEGHEVHYTLYTGIQRTDKLLADDLDIVFINAFSYSAQLAYALSNYYRSKGIVTVLGGPHARSYPDDACLYFDYVLGLTDKELLRDLLRDFEVNKPEGTYLSASSHPQSLPGVRERWEFIEQLHKQPLVFKALPMIGSFGCQHKCDFCVEADIPYQSLDMDVIKEDLQFLVKNMKRPVVGWYDPNLGIQSDSFLDALESAVPPGSINFFAQCTLAPLSEARVKRLKKNGFIFIAVGVESWLEYGGKVKAKSVTGMDKVRQVAEQLNIVQQYIPSVQANIMYGFDNEYGTRPFELTKEFIKLAPGVYPAYNILTAFGHGLKHYSQDDINKRIVPFPYHFMQGLNTLNIKPKNYSWEEFYTHYLDLLEYSFSPRVMYRRHKAVPFRASRWFNLFLSFSVGGSGKKRNVLTILKNLRTNPDFRSFMNRETDTIPAFMIEQVKKDLGPIWEWLPDKTLSQKPNILKESESLVSSM